MKKLLFIVAVLAFASFTNVNKKNKMIPSRYIVAITTLQGNDETLKRERNKDLRLEVFNITRGFQMYGSQNQNGSKEVHILPASKKTRQEISEQLKAVRDVLSVSVVEVSKPIKMSELAEVRKLLTGIGLDASKITNNLLALFIEDKLQEEYTYSMQTHRTRHDEELVPISIIRTEDLPGITPEMLKHTGVKMSDLPDRPLTKDDFRIDTQEVLLQGISYEDVPEYEPPPPPADIKKMTDKELKRWLLKKDPRKLKQEDIKIKRTAEEVFITINFDGVTENFSYRMNK